MMKMKQETMMCMWLIKHLENWDLWKRKLQVQSTYASWATKARLSWASLEQTAISCVCHHLTFFEAFIYSVPSLNEYDIPCCMIVKWYQDEKPAQKRSTALCTALKMSVGYGKDMGVGHRPELIMYCISFSYTAAVVTLDIKHFCWCPWGLVSQGWQAAHWQIPVKHLGIPCFFLHPVPVAAFLQAAAVLPQLHLQGDPAGHLVMVNSCFVSWMSWSPDMFACGMGILLLESVKTPFLRERVNPAAVC